MNKLIEAAARAIRTQGGFSDDKYEHGWSKGYAQAAILAFLEAALEDDATIDALALAASQNSARAALRALIQQVSS